MGVIGVLLALAAILSGQASYSTRFIRRSWPALVLYRAGAGRGRLVDLVRPDARRDAAWKNGKSGPASAVGHVRDGGERDAVALDHRSA
jgi:hypothetical protein